MNRAFLVLRNGRVIRLIITQRDELHYVAHPEDAVRADDIKEVRLDRLPAGATLDIQLGGVDLGDGTWKSDSVSIGASS